MLIFWFGFFVGVSSIVLFFLIWTSFQKKDTSANDRHFRLMEAQLNTFNERMVEERRLACALEAIVEHVTSANRQSTKFCTDDFHKACRIAGCVECPHCKCKV
jgi:hypothetical protein